MAQRIDKDSLKLDQPRRTPGHPTKSHVVKTKIDGKEKILRFGEQGAKTAGKPKAGESQAMKDKRARFKSRHAKNIAKGKSSPAYWADKVKWADGGSVSKGSVDKDKLKEAYGQAAASMRSAGVTGIGGGTRPADRQGPLTMETVRGDSPGMLEVIDRTVFDDDDDDDYVDPISPEMRDYLRSDPGTMAEPAFGPQFAPSVITSRPLGDNVAPLSQLSQPSQPMGFFETIRNIPGAIGRDLKMGWQAGMFRGRDTQRENLMEAGYTPTQIADYFARTDATLARNAAEAAMRGNRDDATMPTNYADLARAFAQEYNVTGRNRTQLMPLLETFLRSRGILDPSTYSENIFNTLSVPMQEGGSVDLARLARRYADGGAVDEDEPSFFSLSGQERRRALDALDEKIGEGLRYYLGPTPIPQLLGFAAEMTPTRSIERASEASQRMLQPGLTPLQRAAAGAEMLGEVAAVGAPIAMGARGAMPMAEAAQEAFMGLSVPARAAAQDVVDRLNQPGPMPTLGSNFGNVGQGRPTLADLEGAPLASPELPAASTRTLDEMLESYDETAPALSAVEQRDRLPLEPPPASTAEPLSSSAAPREAVVGSSVAYRSPTEQREQARQQIQALVEARAPDDPRRKVKIEDIAAFHQQNHLAQHGRQLDPFNAEDFDLAARAAEDEVRYQLGQAVSGKGWYDSDVQKTFEIASGIPGLEDLATNEADRVIMSAIMAPTSIGQPVTANTRAAIAAMRQYKRTGEIPTEPPAPGTVTEGIQNAGWGLKQQSAAAGMRVINHLLKKFGPEGFADWWLSPHTLKELKELRKEAGFSGDNPSGLSGGDKSMHLGAMILGDKTGRFSLNINGYEGTTKDVWFSRSYNRYFGNMFDNKGEVVGGPRNATERRRMEEFTRNLRTRLEDQGLSEQDIQAILWYYEQNLMTDLGVMSRPGAFSEEAERLYGNLRPAIRGGDEAQAAAEPGGLEGFRGISPSQRTIRAERRLSGRVDPRDPRGQTGPYEAGIGAGDEGDGLLVLTPRPDALARYQAAELNIPTIREVPAQRSAAQYNADMSEAMAGHKFGAQVEIKSPEELAQARLFRTEDGSGFAVKPDGDIVAVFAGKDAPSGSGYSMLQAAVAAGGRKLDAFDTYLPKIYETAGFRPVARLPWNDEFAPPNWDKQAFKKYNNGEPDVVFFVYDPSYYGGARNVPVFDDYDAAVAEQTRQLRALQEPPQTQQARGGPINLDDLAQKYARGGMAKAKPKGYAAGGMVSQYDPAMIDQIVNRVRGAGRG
jgi:hypothetical protein